MEENTIVVILSKVALGRGCFIVKASTTLNLAQRFSF